MGPSPPVSPGCHFDHGHIGRVSRKRLLDDGSVPPEEYDATEPLPHPSDQVVEVGALGQPARDPHHRVVSLQRGQRRMRVGGLRVVDPGDVVDDRDLGDPVAVRPERAQRLLHRPGGDAVGPRERRRSEGVRHEVRGVRREVGEGAQLGGRGLPLLDERPIGEHVVDQPEHPDARRAEGEPDGPGAVLHLGVADQLLGDLVGHVVDARPLDAGVDPALVGGVAGHAATRPVVPVEVVLRDVEHRGRLRLDRGGVVQLEAGELHRQDVVRRGVHHRLDDGQPDVAAGDRPQAAGAQHRLEHLHRRGLAVGAGDGQPRRWVLGVAQPPGQLDLAPDRDSSC